MNDNTINENELDLQDSNFNETQLSLKNPRNGRIKNPRKRPQIVISDPTSTFNQDIANTTNSKNASMSLINAPRQAMRDPEKATMQTIENLQERSLSENRKEFYGNPLGFKDSLQSFWLNIRNSSFTDETFARLQDGVDYLRIKSGSIKKEDLIYQKDIDEDENLKALGLQVPETGWTQNQFKRMVEYSQSLAKQDELNRVKGSFGKIAEFGLNIAPYLIPYTAIPFALITDPLIAPLNITGLALARTTAGAVSKVAVAGGVGAIETGVLTGLINEYTENRKFQATGKRLSTEEKINEMIYGGLIGGLSVGGFQAVSNIRGKDAIESLKEMGNFLFTNRKTSAITRQQAVNDIKNNGISNPEAILPEDKSTKADKFDAIQDILKGQTQLKNGIDLDIAKVRDINNDPQFLKSYQSAEDLKANNGFNFFKTQYKVNNKIIETDFEIVEMSSLTPSHNFDGNLNAEYPKQYQPRDRSSVASRMQINEIARMPDAERLIPSLSFFEGSPVVDKSNFVVIGNGRSIGLKEAYKNGRAESYRQKLIDNFPHLNPEGFDEPVLVRKFRPEILEEDIVKLSKISNSDDKLRYNIVETAKLDAQNLFSSGAINYYKKGALTSKDNAEFYKRFLGTLSKEEVGNFLTHDGELSQTGRQRIEASLLQYAYNNDNLTKFIYEDLDPISKTITNTLKDVAPDMIKIKNLIEAKQIDPNLDISTDMSNAFEIYAIHKTNDMDLGNTLNAFNIYGNDVPPLTEAIIRSFFKDEKNASGIISQSKLDNIFNTFVSRIKNSKLTEGSFDFDLKALDPLDILQNIKSQIKPDYFPVKKADYKFKENNYAEQKSVSHEDVKNTLDENGKKEYQKTLDDDNQINEWFKCNTYQK